MTLVLAFSAAMLALSLAILALRWKRTSAERRQFGCPHCGGRYWGSVAPFTLGRCYGCGFTWKRADDARYFGASR